MDYMISRDGQEYGPYSLGDLQRYVSSGEILLSDMTRSEGMTEFMPVSRVIGTIAMPPPASYVPQVSVVPEHPNPPNLHWGLVLLFTLLTRSLFGTIWGLVLAIWVRKYLPESKAVVYYISYFVCLALIFVMAIASAGKNMGSEFLGILVIISAVLMLIARFSLRSSLEEHFNTNEPMALELNGVMTFFFGEIYFQYHVNDIVRRKKLDRLSMGLD